MGIWTADFKNKYIDSLSDYKSFYDDVNRYGRPESTLNGYYFIPGYNGVPGQIRFALPSLSRCHSTDFFVQCLHLDEFSASVPTWDKFSPENLRKKHAKIIADLNLLSTQFAVLSVIVNSSGFYDFLAVYHKLPDSVQTKLKLAWIACAPDTLEPSPWERFFYRLNGFDHGSDRWFAYPNHNWITFVNRECNASKRWRYGSQRKIFFKYDLESRFYAAGILWAYVSISRYNWVIQYNIGQARFPITIPSVVLVASKDGYWFDKSKQEITAVIHRYLQPSHILFRETSHLWVTVPENLSAALDMLQRVPVGADRGK